MWDLLTKSGKISGKAAGNNPIPHPIPSRTIHLTWVLRHEQIRSDPPHFTMVCTLYDLYAWVEGMAFDISRMHASRCVLPSLDHSSLLEQICVGLQALKASNPPRSSEIPPRGSNEEYWKTQVLATRDDVTIERIQENQFCSLLKWTIANLIANENWVLSQGVSMVFEVWDFLRSKFVRRFHVPPSTYIHCLKVFIIFLSHFWFGRQTAATNC